MARTLISLLSLLSVLSATGCGSGSPDGDQAADGDTLADGDTGGDGDADGDTGQPAGLSAMAIAVLTDGNGDRLVNPGEEADLRVTIRNDTGAGIDRLSGTLRLVTGPGVIVCGAVVEAGDGYWGIEPGGTAELREAEEGCYTTGSLKIRVERGAGPGARLLFEAGLAAGDGRSWSVPFAVGVVASGGRLAFDGLEVVSDANRDGVVGPGERADLRLFVRNTGTSRINPLSGTVTSNTPAVAIACGSVVKAPWDYPVEPDERQALAEDEDGCSSPATISIDVAHGTPAGTRADFELNLADPEGNVYLLTFPVAVQATGGRLAFDGLEVVSDANMDGVVSPGERAELRVFIRNTGTSRVNNPRGVLTAGGRWAEIVCGSTVRVPWDYPLDPDERQALAEDEQGCMASGTFSLQVAPDAPVGEEIPFELNLADPEGNTYTLGFPLAIGRHGGALSLDRAEVLSDTGGDGSLDPGDEAQIRLFLRNDGRSRITTLTGSLAAGGPHTTVLCGATVRIPWDDVLEPGQSRQLDEADGGCSCSCTMRIRIDPATPHGGRLPFLLDLRDGEGQPWGLDFVLTVR